MRWHGVDAGTRAEVTLIGAPARAPDLVDHGQPLRRRSTSVLAALAGRGYRVHASRVGSMGGLAAARRGECDLAPIHLDGSRERRLQRALLRDGLALVRGWQRMQGVVFRKGDARFEGLAAARRR